MSNAKRKFIFPVSSKRIIHTCCVSMITEYKNKSLIQNDLSNTKIKFIYPDTSIVSYAHRACQW